MLPRVVDPDSTAFLTELSAWEYFGFATLSTFARN